jgi:hypothetical protein
LERLGQPVDLVDHFGYVRHWCVRGPFDNVDGEGFDTVYPPESRNWRELASRLRSTTTPSPNTSTDRQNGSAESAVSWKSVTCSEPDGDVDLNKVFGELKDVLAYGAAVIESDRQQDVEIRLRVQNAFKLWLNGQLLVEQPVGHTGNSFDQYVVQATLKEGDNLLLIKSCQVKPIQQMAFFDVWHFCVRLSDSTGGGLTGCASQPLGPSTGPE